MGWCSPRCQGPLWGCTFTLFFKQFCCCYGYQPPTTHSYHSPHLNHNFKLPYLCSCACFRICFASSLMVQYSPFFSTFQSLLSPSGQLWILRTPLFSPLPPDLQRHLLLLVPSSLTGTHHLLLPHSPLASHTWSFSNICSLPPSLHISHTPAPWSLFIWHMYMYVYTFISMVSTWWLVPWGILCYLWPI